MNWTQIIGQKKLIEILHDSINTDRVAHAQLFVGEAGYGGLPLVLAYAQELFRRENEHSVTKVETLNHIDLHFSFPVFTKNNNKAVIAIQIISLSRHLCLCSFPSTL